MLSAALDDVGVSRHAMPSGRGLMQRFQGTPGISGRSDKSSQRVGQHTLYCQPISRCVIKAKAFDLTCCRAQRAMAGWKPLPSSGLWGWTRHLDKCAGRKFTAAMQRDTAVYLLLIA